MPIDAQSCGLLLLLLAAAVVPLASPHSCPFSSPAAADHHHHDHNHDHVHDHHHEEIRRARLPEELAEEEDLILDQFDHHHHHHHHHHHNEHETEDSGIGLWVRAMGCSMLVSLASLVCLVLLPVLFLQGKPSKGLVDSLAVFGAGAMLGDAFLHQLPHAFGGGHAHSHHNHDHHEENGEHSHAHSLQDLSVGMSVLFGIILFLIVEKVVRYVEENSGKGVHGIGGHGHHHHHKKKLEDEQSSTHVVDGKTRDTLDNTEEKSLNNESGANGAEGDLLQHGSHIRQRVNVTKDDVDDSNARNGAAVEKSFSTESIASPSQSSLVFGYLNLFSDGVHNFTDGMALGSAFLLHGSVGGWSRTLFLLAHELPQEVGDFGILVRSGFTVTKALFFNFLSAVVALAGTALALVLGKDPGHSSLIEGFTAGGFIYIAVAGVLPELNSGKTTVKTTFSQLSALILGMAIALCISLFE